MGRAPGRRVAETEALHQRPVAGGLGSEHAVELRTEALNDPAAMDRFMDSLGLSHKPARVLAPSNTNLGQGHRATRVTRDDVLLLERFLGRLTPAARAGLRYFEDYRPPAVEAARP